MDQVGENARRAADMSPVSVGWLAASIANMRQFCGVGDPMSVPGWLVWHSRCSCRSPGLAFFEWSATRHWGGVRETQGHRLVALVEARFECAAGDHDAASCGEHAPCP